MSAKEVPATFVQAFEIGLNSKLCGSFCRLDLQSFFQATIDNP